jgi:hypothetical protein
MPVGNRRMINPAITESGTFLMMPLSTQGLYFHLCTHSDDDGVVEAFTVMRMVGAKEDEIGILVAKGFITVLDSGLQLVWLNHWHEHNQLRSDRLEPSQYRELLVKVIPGVRLIKSTKQEENKRRLEKYYQSKEYLPPHKDAESRRRVGKLSGGKDFPIQEEKHQGETEEDSSSRTPEIDISDIDF